MLDTEKELLKEKIQEALIQQSQEQKVIFCLLECGKNVNSNNTFNV